MISFFTTRRNISDISDPEKFSEEREGKVTDLSLLGRFKRGQSTRCTLQILNKTIKAFLERSDMISANGQGYSETYLLDLE